jgi:hypothetical protein
MRYRLRYIVHCFGYGRPFRHLISFQKFAT